MKQKLFCWSERRQGSCFYLNKRMKRSLLLCHSSCYSFKPYQYLLHRLKSYDLHAAAIISVFIFFPNSYPESLCVKAEKTLNLEVSKVQISDNFNNITWYQKRLFYNFKAISTFFLSTLDSATNKTLIDGKQLLVFLSLNTVFN